jgi:uncharacterized protein (TIGR03435 family)
MKVAPMKHVVAVLLSLPVLVRAQAPAKPSPNLTFEVASLKPSPKDTRPGGIRPTPGGERYEANGCPLKLMIQVAYRLKAEQVVGGPAWMDTDLFDMNAKAEKPSTTDELHLMLQNLLAERFKLQFHRSAKEMPMYALTVDKGGPKMQAHQAASAGDPWIDQAQDKPFHLNLTATFAPMDYFAWRLSMLMDLPVVDHTGLKGGYDFKLLYTRDVPPNIPEGAQLNGQPIDTSGPTIFEALRQQLGLKLDKTKGPVDTMAIDHVEKPDAN